MVAARAAQGIGAATLAPAALSLLTATFPTGKQRIRAFGVWSAMNAAGGAFGVLAGGLLTQYAGWRWVMFVSVPMAAVALALAWRGVPTDSTTARAGRPDVLGAVLATAGMTLLVFGVVRTDRYPWSSATTLLTLLIAVALLAAFIAVEQTTRREPLIRLGLFANRSVSGANAFNLLVGAAMASAFYFMSLYLQRVLGIGPAETGRDVPAVRARRGRRRRTRRQARLPASARTLLVGRRPADRRRIRLVRPDQPPMARYLTNILGPSIVASVGFGLCLGPVVSTATAGVDPRETGHWPQVCSTAPVSSAPRSDSPLSAPPLTIAAGNP